VPPLVEVAGSDLPVFSDDLDLAELDRAIVHSLAWLGRIASAEPGRTFAFGPERVPVARMVETLSRFRAIVAARPSADSLQTAIAAGYRVFRSSGADGRGEVLFTGYYLPELRGSETRTDAFAFPLYRPPPDLVTASTKDFPQLDSDLVGRVVDGRLKPYPTRAEIVSGALTSMGAELLWVDSAVDAFFLEIQGSGLVRLPDGAARVVTFAGRNGRPYSAVGGELLRRGAVAREAMSMQTIRAWLDAHPDERAALMNTNPSQVFFRTADAAIGALGEPVTPGRTIAADSRVFPKGGLCFVETQRPVDESGPAWRPFSRFVLDQDSGGAIRGAGRADVYWGSGAYAERTAGELKHPGRLYYLLAKQFP